MVQRLFKKDIAVMRVQCLVSDPTPTHTASWAAADSIGQRPAGGVKIRATHAAHEKATASAPEMSSQRGRQNTSVNLQAR